MISAAECQGPLNGGVSNGGVSRSGLVLPFLSFFADFWVFPVFFPICSGMVRGFSRFVLFLFLGLLRAPTRNSPERVRDTIWTFPEKSGKHLGLETPRFSFSQEWLQARLRPPWSLRFCETYFCAAKNKMFTDRHTSEKVFLSSAEGVSLGGDLRGREVRGP